MAMLAERRQKHRPVLNPRGKYWTEDSNKIGQKMLEKMGWTNGKGLGSNEQGRTEYCRVSYKNDTTGMGYDKTLETWTEHQEKFEDFLQQLQGNLDQNIVQLENKNGDLSVQSMEFRSKRSRARVHYQKLVRGKDLNSYKSKDLANIFGQKELTDKVETSVGKSHTTYENEAIGTEDNRHGIVTINGGNMIDYFKDKLNGKLNYDKSVTNSMADNEAIASENENERIGFGFASKVENALSIKSKVLKDSGEKSNYVFHNPCLGLNNSMDSIPNNDDASKKSSKRRKGFENAGLNFNEIDRLDVQRKKKLKTEAFDSNRDNAFTNPALNLNATSEESHNGKEFEISRAEFGVENCGLDLTDEKIDKKRVTFSDHIMLYEYNIDSCKKKKKKEGQATLDKFEVENKKHKKKRKHESSVTPFSDGIINEALDIEMVCDEINDNELNEHRSKKNKKRKICKISSLETIEESPEQEKEIIDIIAESNVITLQNETKDVDKKLKKKKKKVQAEEIVEIDITDEESNMKSEETIKTEQVGKDKNKEGGTLLILKKCKKKKKDKENGKSELKHIVETEINGNEKKIDILEQLDMKQQEINHSVEIEDENAMKLETLSDVVVTIDEDGEQKRKKKKKKSIDKEDCSKNERSIRDVEKGISDKENAEKSQDLAMKKLTKKDKKRKKSEDMDDVSDIVDSSCNTEAAHVSGKEENIGNVEFVDATSKKNKLLNGIIHSPSNARVRISKKRLISLFHSNPKSNFPDSNIHDIKGYSDNIKCYLE